LRPLTANPLKLHLNQCSGRAIAQHHTINASVKLSATVLSYILERLKAGYEDNGITAEVFMAVSAKQLSKPLDIDQRVNAVQAFTKLPEAAALAAANKRVSNILAKAEGQLPGQIDTSLLVEAAEQILAQQLNEQHAIVAPLFAAARFEEGLTSLAGLQHRRR